MFHALIVLALVSQPPNSAAPSRHLVVTGTVRDQDDNPIEHARIFLSKSSEDDGREHVVARGETDPEGRFRVETDYRVAPNSFIKSLPVTLWSISPKNMLLVRSLANANPLISKVETLRYSNRFESTRIVLAPDRKPVDRARIAPASLRSDGAIKEIPQELIDKLTFECDHEGKATIRGVDVSSLDTIRVDTRAFGRQFVRSLKDGEPIVLSPVGSLKGRLIATDRSIVGGKTLVIVSRAIDSKMSFPTGEAVVSTDADGRFEVPAIVAGETTIELRTTDKDRRRYLLEDRSIPIIITQGDVVAVDPGIYDPEREKRSGRVVDRAGNPVADAEVFTRGDTPATVATKTDRDGRFTLTGVPRARFFVFVKKEGYRFGGSIVSKGERSIALRIAKSDEEPIEPMKTLPDPLSQAERMALAQKVLEPVVERFIKSGDESGAVRSLQTLARVDPERAIDLIDQLLLKNQSDRETIIRFASIYRSRDSIEDALLYAGKIENHYLRLLTINGIIQRIPPSEKQTRLDELNRVIVLAKSDKDPINRVVFSGQFAKRLFEIDEVELATKLLRDVVEDARRLQITGSGSVRGAFAEALCRVDLPAALELIAKLPDRREFDRYHGNVAHMLAGRSSADAERVLSMLKNDHSHDDYACRVCYRMASIDLPRARKIAAAIGDDTLRGYALGVMSERLSETDKTEAKKLLDASFDTLERRADAGYEERFKLLTPAIIAASLIPVAEKIHPALVSEYFWRAISCRYPIEQRKHHKIIQIWDGLRESRLAIFLSRYDRVIARSIIALLNSESKRDSSYFSAMAAIDPIGAFDLFEKIDESEGPNTRDLKNLLRIVLGESFARGGEDYWRYARSWSQNLWVPDTVGVDPYL